MSYLGDITLNQVLNGKFTTVNTSGVPTAFTGTPILAVYKNNDTTQSQSGMTVTTDFDSLTGLHNVLIDTSQNGSFYATACDFDVVILAGTVSSQSLTGYIPFSFSIQNRSALRPTTAGRTLDVSSGGEAGIDWSNIGSPTTTQNLIATSIFAAGTVSYLTTIERNAVADALLDRNMSTGTDSGSSTVRTPRQALRFLRNKWTILSGTLSVKKEDDSTESWTGTVGTTTSTDGITSLDPAGP